MKIIDPFADEETTKEPENLTMKQRVAKIMEEEKIKIKNKLLKVLKTGIFIFQKEQS